MSDRWLALSYRVPTEPSRNRVHVWRRMKELGAVYLQPGIAVLPENDELDGEIRRLRDDILSMDGQAAILALSFDDQEDEQRLREEFCALRDQEYGEIIEKCELLIEELDHETKAEKFTFAEIEENEAELQKISRWMQKVVSRDFFSAQAQETAVETISRVTELATAYADEVYRREVPPRN